MGAAQWYITVFCAQSDDVTICWHYPTHLVIVTFALHLLRASIYRKTRAMHCTVHTSASPSRTLRHKSQPICVTSDNSSNTAAIYYVQLKYRRKTVFAISLKNTEKWCR